MLGWGPIARKYAMAFGEAPPQSVAEADTAAFIAACRLRAQGMIEGELSHDGCYAVWRTTRWQEGCASAPSSAPPGAIAPGGDAGAEHANVVPLFGAAGAPWSADDYDDEDAPW